MSVFYSFSNTYCSYSLKVFEGEKFWVFWITLANPKTFVMQCNLILYLCNPQKIINKTTKFTIPRKFSSWDIWHSYSYSGFCNYSHNETLKVILMSNSCDYGNLILIIGFDQNWLLHHGVFDNFTYQIPTIVQPMTEGVVREYVDRCITDLYPGTSFEGQAT